MHRMLIPGVVAAVMAASIAAYAVDGVVDCRGKGTNARRECNDSNDQKLSTAIDALTKRVADLEKALAAGPDSELARLRKRVGDLETAQAKLAKAEDIEKAIVGRRFRLVTPQPQDFCLTFGGNNAAPVTPQNCEVGGTPQVWVLRPH